MRSRIPLMVIPLHTAKNIGMIFLGLENKIAAWFSGLKRDLKETDLGVEDYEYAAASLTNALFIFIVFSSMLYLLNIYVQKRAKLPSLGISIGLGLTFALLIFIILIRYPRVIAGKKAEQVDKQLIFALKDLLMQVTSGISLYNAMVNISKTDYGQISLEFERTAKNISTGMSMNKALEKMALESRSAYLRRAAWQMINALKAGASLKGALHTLISDLTREQRTKISSYAHELNLWTLVYMLFAVAVPTIGGVMLIILSSFAGFGASQGMFIFFITLCFLIQIALIGLIKARRPIVNF